MPSSFLSMTARGPERTKIVSLVTKINRSYHPFMYFSTEETHICVSSGIPGKQQRQMSLFMEGILCPNISPASSLLPCSSHPPAPSAALHCIPPIPPIFPCGRRPQKSYGAKHGSEEVVIVNPSGVTSSLSHPPCPPFCPFPSNCASYGTVFNPEVQTDGHI